MTEQYEHPEYTRAAEIIADLGVHRGKGQYREERDRRLACDCPSKRTALLRVVVGHWDDGTPARWILTAGRREPAVSNTDGSPIEGAPNIPPAPPMCATYLSADRAAVTWRVIEPPDSIDGIKDLRERYAPHREDGWLMAARHGMTIPGRFDLDGTWVPEAFRPLALNVRCPRCWMTWMTYESMRVPGEIHVVPASWPTRGRLIPA